MWCTQSRLATTRLILGFKLCDGANINQPMGNIRQLIIFGEMSPRYGCRTPATLKLAILGFGLTSTGDKLRVLINN